MALELPTGDSTRELIKCVVIGDSGVGKTKLICAQTLGQGMISPEPQHSLLQCSHGSHKPSIFAIDKYYKSPDIQARSNLTIDGVAVALRMWDTFGDHQNDRKFAYQHAHVVALCFAVNCPPSLQSINNYWYNEIKQSCPRVPIILIGTKCDCRLQQPPVESSTVKYASFSKQIRECSMVSPSLGRQVAHEIGAKYYECSVLSMIGLEDVFHNVIRAALCCQRAKQLLPKHLRKVLPPQIQVPYKPPQPKTPQIDVPPSTFHTDLGSLLDNDLYYDLVFTIQGLHIKAHKAIMVAASSTLSSLLGVIEEKELLSQPFLEDVGTTWPRKCFELEKNVDEAGRALTVIHIDNSISFHEFYNLLELLYTGTTSATTNVAELIDAAKLLKVKLIIDLHSDVNTFSVPLWKDSIVHNMRQVLFKKGLFSDVCFELDDAIIPAHKAILVSRCKMMAAMFEEGHFKEANRQTVKLADMNLECFLAVLEYMYTDEVSKEYQGSKVAVMAVANFFCLPRLVALYEKLIVEEIGLDMSNVRNVIEYLLAAEMHNATQLKSWGEHYIIIHYEKILQQNQTALELLPVKMARAMETKRWPPLWYLVENEWYVKTIKENEAMCKLQEKRRWYQRSHQRN